MQSSLSLPGLPARERPPLAPLPAADGNAILRARQSARARLHDAIPKGYSPWLHLACTAGVGVVALVLGCLQLTRPTLLEWLTVPIVFVIANGFEWRAHKDLLHHRRKPMHALYDRHTPEHHMVFGYDDMAIRSTSELKLVLIPAIGVAAIVLTAAPIAWLLGHFWSPNRGWLMLMTSALYVVGYELSHLSYHLPADSFIGRMHLVRVLREHHRRHHHPRLMQRWNFNVTIPLFDFLHRTIAPKKLLDETLEGDASTNGSSERGS